MLEMTRKMSATKACTCIVLAVMCLDLCKIGQCMNLMRFEVMERDDLAILYQSRLMNQTGNLEYGDPCTTSGNSDVVDDVCMRSKLTLQCIGGTCQCMNVRLSDQQVTQLVWEEGSCKSPEGLSCNENGNCLSGHQCQEVEATSAEQTQDNISKRSGQENINSTSKNLSRTVMKGKLRQLLQYSEPFASKSQEMISARKVADQQRKPENDLPWIIERNTQPVRKICVKSEASRLINFEIIKILTLALLLIFFSNAE